MKRLCITTIFICILLILCPPVFLQEQKEDFSVVTIEQALKTSYIKDEEKNTEVIKFSGNVVVSVVKDKNKTIIKADLINFNRKRNVLYASGNVVMKQFESGKQTKSLTAQSVLFNTSTLEGIFYGSKVVHRQQESVKLPDGSKLIVFSDFFAKDSADVVTFKNGQLTFCDDENPHWKIKASRIWLLPGNEFAFANALLYVGAVPLMYFPFFYYPKDELFFNPSFGYRPREGYFVQTTTYFMGRKPLKGGTETSKGFNFMQPSSLYEQELSGLVLRNLNTVASMPPYFFKFMADYYSTLGTMVGLAGDFKFNTFFKSLSFDIRLGFSNTIYPIEGYTQYMSYSSQKQKHADFGWFFGSKLPFRYSVSFKTAMKKNNFSLSVALPLYSDPKFASDFSDRKETMDWIDFFLKGAFSGAGKTEDVVASSPSASSISSISSYTWDVNGSYSPSFPSLSPWLESFSISSLNSSVLFSQHKTPEKEFEGDSDWYKNSPNRDFFYPIQIKPFSFSVAASGTLFSLPLLKERAVHTGFAAEEKSEDSLRMHAIQKQMVVPEPFAPLLTDIADGEDSSISEKAQSLAEKKDENEENGDKGKRGLFAETTLPDIFVPKTAGEKNELLSYKLSYAFKPNFSSLLTFNPLRLTGSGTSVSTDFSLKDPKSSEVAIKTPFDLNSSFAWNNSLLSLSNGFSFLWQYQSHPILSDLYTIVERERIILNDHIARKIDVANVNALTFKPLIFFPVFKESSFSWNTGIRFLQSSFSGTVSNPKWAYFFPKWDTRSLTKHNLNFTLTAKEAVFSQSFSIQANLPPLIESYTGKLDFLFPIGRASLEAGYRKRDLRNEKWYFLPLRQSSSWTFFPKNAEGKDNKNKLSLAQKFSYNVNDKHAERFDVGISWRSFRLSYEMLYSYFYSFSTIQGWRTSQKKKFLPYVLSANVNLANAEFTNKAKNISVKPALSSALSWNIVKPTDSYFSFSPSLTLKINRFLNLTFSTESRNKELLRYMQKAVGFTPEIPGERNIFMDLLNSFAFWDESKRISSGFKLKHINIKIEHDLHDWVLNSEFKVEPRLITAAGGGKKYDYKPYFTLSVLWKPMRGIKTVIRDKYGEFILNPAK